jgi:hypothetical protein
VKVILAIGLEPLTGTKVLYGVQLSAVMQPEDQLALPISQRNLIVFFGFPFLSFDFTHGGLRILINMIK